ncbi:MAG: rod shape-determining protein MreD [Spirochaetia bacterium]|nr:rod shape-determining protein MreD [Spirochaetia bacterium]
MFLEFLVVAIGLVVSFFLKGFRFLSLNFSFMGSGLIFPDFLLIFVIFFALRRGEFAGLWIGFFAGILEDSGIRQYLDVAGEFVPLIGVHSLVYTMAGFILGKMNRVIDKDRVAPIMAIVLGTSIVVRFLVWLFMGWLEDFNKSYSFVGPAVYTALVSPMWFWLLSWLYKIESSEIS